MTKGINKVTLLRNLDKDPKVHSTDSNKVIATISLATTDSYKDKAGEWIEQTQWHYITLFNRLAEIAHVHLKKAQKSILKVVFKAKNGRIKTVTNRQR